VLRVDWGVSWESQVSESARMSMLEAVMKSWRTAGLLISEVTHVAERMLRWAKFRLCVDVGPGLRLISPLSRRSMQKRK
jgi:hypothetical protein